MNKFAKLVAWFWEHYPAELGWSIRTSVSSDNTIRVIIGRHGQDIVVHTEAVTASDSLFERQERAIKHAIEQLKGNQG